jgi:hypothetical protein
METEPARVPHAEKRRRWIIVLMITGAAVMARVLLAPTNYTHRLPLHFLHEVPVGWWGFVKRTIPQIQLEPSAIVLAVLSFLIAVALTHTVGRRFSQAWSWRTSIAASLSPFVLFAITVSASGAQMRITQLLTDKRSIESSNLAEYFAWQNIEMDLKARNKGTGTQPPAQ